MTQLIEGVRGRSRDDEQTAERPGSPARGVLVGLAVVAPFWAGVAYAVHLLLARL